MKNPELIAKKQGSLREAFGESITKLANNNKKIILLDADIAGGTGAHHFRKKHFKQFIQCGIAEQNMISVSAGIASLGFIPIATTFAVFALRAFEQARLSVSYSNLNVKIVASNGGIDTGPDGASAQCIEDLACFRSLPNFVVLCPSDSNEMYQATKAILKHKGPVYMRTGRSNINNFYNKNYKFKIGKGHVLNEGKEICIFSTGIQTSIAFKAVKTLKMKGVNTTLISMPTIKPIDKKIIIKYSKKNKYFISFEDHSIIGGLGAAISEVIAEGNFVKLIKLGINDEIGRSGEANELRKKFKLDQAHLIKTVLKLKKL